MGAVDALGRGGLAVQARDIGGGHDLGGVAAHDRRILGKEPAGRLVAIACRADPDRVEHPGAPAPARDIRCRLHADDPIGGQGADVDDQGLGDRAEILRLLRRVDHRRRSADRQQRVGRDVHRHIIGHRLNERPPGAQSPEKARGFGGEGVAGEGFWAGDCGLLVFRGRPTPSGVV